MQPQSGRKIGEALRDMYNKFVVVKGKAHQKMLLFLFVHGNNQGDQNLLAQYGDKLKKLGKLGLACLQTAKEVSVLVKQ